MICHISIDDRRPMTRLILKDPNRHCLFSLFSSFLPQTRFRPFAPPEKNMKDVSLSFSETSKFKRPPVIADTLVDPPAEDGLAPSKHLRV